MTKTSMIEFSQNILSTPNLMEAVKSVFSYQNLVHAIAGSTGSVVAMTIFYPLDTARTRLQVDDKRKAKHSPVVMAEIAREEGLFALYRGLFPVLSTLWCSNFIYFYSYNSLKIVFLGSGVITDPMKDLTFAFIAGVINVLVTTPLWVVNTRLKLQGSSFITASYRESKQPKYSGIFDALWKIWRHEGVQVLWNGTVPSLWLATNPAIQFMVYETIKRYFQRMLNTQELSGVLYFLIGAAAKTAATIVTYPLQVLQSRLRAGYSKIDRSKGLVQMLLDLVRSQGMQVLYKGMEAKLLQTVVTAAMMFLTYEKIAAFIFHLMGQEYSKSKTI